MLIDLSAFAIKEEGRLNAHGGIGSLSSLESSYDGRAGSDVDGRNRVAIVTGVLEEGENIVTDDDLKSFSWSFEGELSTYMDIHRPCGKERP